MPTVHQPSPSLGQSLGQSAKVVPATVLDSYLSERACCQKGLDDLIYRLELVCDKLRGPAPQPVADLSALGAIGPESIAGQLRAHNAQMATALDRLSFITLTLEEYI